MLSEWDLLRNLNAEAFKTDDFARMIRQEMNR
jgi:hypothetical protein